MREIVKLDELSEYLNISKSTLRNMVKKKEIPYFRIGNRIRFDMKDINDWVIESKEREFKSFDLINSVKKVIQAQ